MDKCQEIRNIVIETKEKLKVSKQELDPEWEHEHEGEGVAYENESNFASWEQKLEY